MDTFQGWFTDASAGTQVTASTTVSLAGNQTLYAHWLQTNIPVFMNVEGAVKQVDKAYANVGGSIKEVTLYANVGGVIKTLI